MMNIIWNNNSLLDNPLSKGRRGREETNIEKIHINKKHVERQRHKVGNEELDDEDKQVEY